MSKLETNTIDTVSGTTNLTIGSTNASTVTFENGAVTGHMFPAFEAYLSSDQTVTDATNTKVQIDTELFDTDNCYDNSTNYRFTPNVAGKYFVYVRLTFQTSIITDLRDGELRLFKNGLEYSTTDWRFSSSDIQTAGETLNTTVDMNGSTDYLEVYGYNNVVSGTPSFTAGSSSEKRTLFGAYRIGA